MPENPSPFWSYSPRSRRYRDNRTGRYLSLQQVVNLRSVYIAREAASARAATLSLMEGNGSLSSWLHNMQQAIKDAHAAAYLLGRGGLTQPSEEEYRALGRVVREQYHYLERLALQMAEGRLSARQAANRASLYLENINQSYSRGYQRAWGDFELPAYPADGSMFCKSRCQCFWHIEQTDKGIEATWIRSSEDSCLICVQYAATWNPYTIPALEA